MENIKPNYEALKQEFKEFKSMANKRINKLEEEREQLGRSLAMLYNVVEISNYINSSISKKNLIQLINDMIIGILGATHSTIYLVENGKLNIKATNVIYDNNSFCQEITKQMQEGEIYIMNSEQPLNYCVINSIHSRMGIPIKVGDKLIGYVVVEHTHYEFFNEDHKVFVNTIANQIGIAIENSNLYRKLEVYAKMDSLMGIYNRRSFFEIVEKKIKKNIKNKKSNTYAIVMMDLDNFKIINDTLGHQFGDEVLIQVANILKGNLTEKDVIGRYGGEEIIIFISDGRDINKVYEKIDNIRKIISCNEVVRDGVSKSVTSSFGLSFALDRGDDLSRVIEEADEMLYRAKHNGKNRVICAKCPSFSY